MDINTKNQPASNGRRPGDAQPTTMSRFGDLLRRVPNYTRLAWGLARDDRLGGPQKAILYAGLGYMAMPLDLVPGFIPVAGQLDDMAAILIALRTVLYSLPETVAESHLQKSGLTYADLDYDLGTLGLTAVWIAQRAGALAARGLGLAASALAARVTSGFGRRRQRLSA